MKNYTKEGQKLPLFGIGPYLICGIALLALAGILLSGNVLSSGILDGIWIPVFRITGAILILSGAFIWYKGALGSNMDEHIENNKLKTDGIYAWVRNPMYSGWWFLVIGVTLMWHNARLLLLIPLDWIILTIVLKNTEEKWLLDLYGEEYAAYKRSVNRCIPFKRMKG
ncbi:MAG: isoprenylcysteine carboxylmethyltransferase family protein [Saccharofermentans sp.]|nr:isoprenylcysteine carboxylmethyltransferase family protein [Saccharofermentans sp.]